MDQLTFQDFPRVLNEIQAQLIELKTLIQSQSNEDPSDKWLSLDELINYLPGNPAKGTVYMWVHERSIPHKKFGKRLAFLQSEIDQWLNDKGRKTRDQIKNEVEETFRK